MPVESIAFARHSIGAIRGTAEDPAGSMMQQGPTTWRAGRISSPRPGGAAGGAQVVDQNDALAGRMALGVHFHLGEPYSSDRRSEPWCGKLALLADRHKEEETSRRQGTAEDEATRPRCRRPGRSCCRPPV